MAEARKTRDARPLGLPTVVPYRGKGEKAHYTEVVWLDFSSLRYHIKVVSRELVILRESTQMKKDRIFGSDRKAAMRFSSAVIAVLPDRSGKTLVS